MRNYLHDFFLQQLLDFPQRRHQQLMNQTEQGGLDQEMLQIYCQELNNGDKEKEIFLAFSINGRYRWKQNHQQKGIKESNQLIENISEIIKERLKNQEWLEWIRQRPQESSQQSSQESSQESQERSQDCSQEGSYKLVSSSASQQVSSQIELEENIQFDYLGYTPENSEYLKNYWRIVAFDLKPYYQIDPQENKIDIELNHPWETQCCEKKTKLAVCFANDPQLWNKLVKFYAFNLRGLTIVQFKKFQACIIETQENKAVYSNKLIRYFLYVTDCNVVNTIKKGKVIKSVSIYKYLSKSPVARFLNCKLEGRYFSLQYDDQLTQEIKLHLDGLANQLKYDYLLGKSSEGNGWILFLFFSYDIQTISFELINPSYEKIPIIKTYAQYTFIGAASLLNALGYQLQGQRCFILPFNDAIHLKEINSVANQLHKLFEDD